MQIPPERFWPLTLAEWRALVDGFSDRMKMERRQMAWSVSHLMNASGNYKAGAITPAKLLGEKEPERGRPVKAEGQKLPIDVLFKLLKEGGKVIDGEK